MLRYVFILILSLFGGLANAHQFLPTYPKFELSFVDGVVSTKMELFNKRKEVEYYELGVFDADWNPLPFASESVIFNVKYLETKTINVYIKKEDLKRVMYICTESRLRKSDSQYTLISSNSVPPLKSSASYLK